VRVSADDTAQFVEAIAERAAELVLERHVTADPSAAASPFVTPMEAAELLRCDRQRVYDLLSKRRLSRLKEGGRTLLDRAEVLALVREGSPMGNGWATARGRPGADAAPGRSGARLGSAVSG
jgi:excisionase family DNA binding protein